MKNSKVLFASVIIAGVLVMACGGLGSVGQISTTLEAATPFPTTAPANSVPVTGGGSAPADVAGLENAYEAVYQKDNASVVLIEIGTVAGNQTGPGFSFGQGNGQNNQGSQQIVPSALGSGVVWDNAGHIVTNNHVVDGAARITVTFSDGASYDAKVVGTDPHTDLAVIQVNGAPASEIKPITVGDSTQVRVGQMVVAIGNPFGLSNTMTTGIVSAIGRSISAGAGNGQQGTGPVFSIPDVIQTDAAINPGNSGGALVDMNGALIGVPSQIESPSGSNSGIGFAIPSAIVKQVAQQLISNGKASHSYLGISGITVTSDVISALNLRPGQQGILVADVVPGGPAENAGLKGAQLDQQGNPTAAGDIITGIDGHPVSRFEDLISYLYAKTQPGQKVTLTVFRNGQEIQVPLVLGTQPSQ